MAALYRLSCKLFSCKLWKTVLSNAPGPSQGQSPADHQELPPPPQTPAQTLTRLSIPNDTLPPPDAATIKVVIESVFLPIKAALGNLFCTVLWVERGYTVFTELGMDGLRYWLREGVILQLTAFCEGVKARPKGKCADEDEDEDAAAIAVLEPLLDKCDALLRQAVTALPTTKHTHRPKPAQHQPSPRGPWDPSSECPYSTTCTWAGERCTKAERVHTEACEHQPSPAIKAVFKAVASVQWSIMPARSAKLAKALDLLWSLVGEEGGARTSNATPLTPLGQRGTKRIIKRPSTARGGLCRGRGGGVLARTRGQRFFHPEAPRTGQGGVYSQRRLL